MPKIVAERTEWVRYGFELFARHGASALIVDKMARKLTCNRSSFYWHFNSKEKFIDEIIKYWVEFDTDQIINQVEKASTPDKKFKVFIATTFKSDPYIDFIFHLKRYAIKRKDIQTMIDKINKQRIDFVSSLLVDLGYSETESMEKASIFYKYLIGHHEMIKYKKQPKNHIEDIYQELKHFIDL